MGGSVTLENARDECKCDWKTLKGLLSKKRAKRIRVLIKSKLESCEHVQEEPLKTLSFLRQNTKKFAEIKVPKFIFSAFVLAQNFCLSEGSNTSRKRPISPPA